MPAFAARPLHERFKFQVSIGHVESAEFARCSEVKQTVEKIEYREGGALIPYKVPGLVSFDDVTLERGTSDNRDLYDWMLQAANAAGAGGGTGLPDPEYRRNITINQLRRDNQVVRGWDLYFAWPTEFTGGAWDNSASEVVIESLVLTYDFARLVAGEVATSGES